MKRVLDSREMYVCDRAAMDAGTPSRTLMAQAAAACADAVVSLLGRYPAAAHRVLVLCGGGNNGGDGLCMARMLCERDISADVCVVGYENGTLSAECAYRYDEVLGAGVSVLSHTAVWAEDYTVIVDALFGIGLSRAPAAPYDTVIARANAYAEEKRIPMIALDIPSGVDASSGAVYGACIRADVTLAIANAKRGHYLYPGAAMCGEICVLDVGIPDTPLALEEDDRPLYLLSDEDIPKLLPVRAPDSNKGTNGRILVIAGSAGMCGAAYLCARAAYRTGAGLVEILTCEENRIPLQTLLPEAVLTTYRPCDDISAVVLAALARADGCAVGPGLGQSETAWMTVRTVLENAAVPVVLDADALNLIASYGMASENGAVRILTPHPGEFSRLTGMSVSALKQDFIGSARAFAEQYGAILNAKDAHSVITDGRVSFLNPTGNSALAKGGSGDVLCGITAVLAAQMCREASMILPNGTVCASALCAAALGAYLHGRAAEWISETMGQRAPLASEICDAVGAVLCKYDTMI